MDAENRNGETSAYRGVRKRKSGKWASEVREPGKKNRIWLGSFETPEMAAMAHDTAMFFLRGQFAQLNFPHLVQYLPRPVSSNSYAIRLAAQEASLMMARQNGDDGGRGTVDNGGGGTVDNGDGGSGPAAVRVGLSPAQLQAILDVPLDSPEYGMWADMEHQQPFSMYCPYPGVDEGCYEEVPDDTLWD